jgi:hypothetical protein
VEKNRSLNSTYRSFSTIIDIRKDGPSQTEPMSFAPGPVLVSGGQIDLSTKQSSSIDIQLAFDHTLKHAAGGARMSSGSSRVSSEENAAF